MTKLWFCRKTCTGNIQGFSKGSCPGPTDQIRRHLKKKKTRIESGRARRDMEISRDGPSRVRTCWKSHGSGRVTLTRPDPREEVHPAREKPEKVGMLLAGIGARVDKCRRGDRWSWWGRDIRCRPAKPMLKVRAPQRRKTREKLRHPAREESPPKLLRFV